jgi:hypothetical protein
LLSHEGCAVICARVESSKRCGEAGWLHRLHDDAWRPSRHGVRSVRLEAGHPPAQDFGAMAAEWQAGTDSVRLERFAHSLGLSVEALAALHAGWSTSHNAWSFPMADPSGTVLGIRLRRWNGFKFAIKGGREGLIIPTGTPNDSHMVIAEGVTDVAALWDMGFRSLIGRPSATGGIKLLVELVQRRQTAEVVIVADGDEPGRRGADNLASVLVVYCHSVRVIEPPAGIKDVRDWLRSGGNRRAVEQLIEAAPARRLAIRTREVCCGR